ncbi:MAG: nucleotidyltransferase substrate binding protein [Myxococcaceae bacterium]
MKDTDVRWQQRFTSFKRAFSLLQEALGLELAKMSALEKEGAMQRFEFTFELAWKTLKDFLEESGAVLEEVTPRNVLKVAFAARLIPDGQVWIDMMLRRNEMSHQYDGEKFASVLIEIRQRYLPILVVFHDDFARRVSTP